MVLFCPHLDAHGSDYGKMSSSSRSSGGDGGPRSFSTNKAA